MKEGGAPLPSGGPGGGSRRNWKPAITEPRKHFRPGWRGPGVDVGELVLGGRKWAAGQGLGGRRCGLGTAGEGRARREGPAGRQPT